MTMNNDDLLRIQRALAELDAIVGASNDRTEVPFYGPTLLASMTAQDQDMAISAEQATYDERPSDSAVHFCLTSAIALLEVSQALLSQPANPTPQEREHHSRTLVAYVKTAGRSAYRAASILADQHDL